MVCKKKLTGHVWNLEEHGGHKVDTLKQLQVNVHVIRHLTTLLNLLLLSGSLMLALQQQALTHHPTSTSKVNRIGLDCAVFYVPANTIYTYGQTIIETQKDIHKSPSLH